MSGERHPVRVLPEVARRLDEPVPAGLRVTVGGVAGGVGTTTVTALLRAAAAWRTGPGRLEVVDGGREPWLTGPPGDVVVVVCAATPASLNDALAAARAVTGPAGLGRVVVAPVAVRGRGPGDAALLRAAADRPGCAVVPVPQDRALAAGAGTWGPGGLAAVPAVAPRAVALLAAVLDAAR